MITVYVAVLGFCAQPNLARHVWTSPTPQPFQIDAAYPEPPEPPHTEEEDRIEYPSTFQPAAISGALGESTHAVDVFVAAAAVGHPKNSDSSNHRNKSNFAFYPPIRQPKDARCSLEGLAVTLRQNSKILVQVRLLPLRL